MVNFFHTSYRCKEPKNKIKRLIVTETDGTGPVLEKYSHNMTSTYRLCSYIHDTANFGFHGAGATKILGSNASSCLSCTCRFKINQQKVMNTKSVDKKSRFRKQLGKNLLPTKIIIKCNANYIT